MALGTALSRGTGLARTVALAWVLGVGIVSDAYNTANTAPNMIFVLVAGGALSSALVPILVQQDEPSERAEVASALFGAVIAVAAVVTVAVVLLAPSIMRVLTAGAAARPGYGDYLALTSTWLRMFAPQIFFYAVSVYAVGVMTARRRLALGAFAPVATNLVTIAVALAFGAALRSVPSTPAAVDDGARMMAGLGTTFAVGIMAGLQLWGARRCEPGLTVRFRPRHPAVRRLAQVGGWVLVYVLVNQIGLAVVISVANRVAGGVTSYQWAFMIMQLPYAIVAVSLLSASIAGIAKGSTTDPDVSALVARPGRATLVLLLPASVGLAFLAQPLAVIVVGPDDSNLVAVALAGFALSLVPFSIFQILTRTSYAVGRTRSPALVNIGVNLVNVAFVVVGASLADSPRQVVAALAVGHALSYVAGCLLLHTDLRSSGVLQRRVFTLGLSRIVAASTLLALALAAVPDQVLHVGSRWSAVLVVVATGAVGSALYLATARMFGVQAAGLDRLVIPGRRAPRPTG